MDDFKAGIYENVEEHLYHSRMFGPQESLSSTEAKNILKAPKYFKHIRDNGQAASSAFDFGSAVHKLVLGTGPELYVYPWENLRTKAAQQDVAQHRDNGEIVVSKDTYDQCMAAADAVLTHPIAQNIFTDDCRAEVSLYGKDFITGAWMRGRIDWLNAQKNCLYDLKTTTDASPDAFNRTVVNYKYELQAAWYIQLWETLTGQKNPEFKHILVEKKPPYLVSVCRLDIDYIDVGKHMARKALDIYHECVKNNEWPGLDNEALIAAPSWLIDNMIDEELEVE